MQDFLLLSKDDLIEMKLPIACRNRIIIFQKHLKDQHTSIECADGSSIGPTEFDINEIINKVVRG